MSVSGGTICQRWGACFGFFVHKQSRNLSHEHLHNEFSVDSIYQIVFGIFPPLIQVTSCWSKPHSGNLTEWENKAHWDMTWISLNFVWMVRRRSLLAGSDFSLFTISTFQWSLVSPSKSSKPYVLHETKQKKGYLIWSELWEKERVTTNLTSLWYSTSVIGGRWSCECNRLLESLCLKVMISPSLMYSISVTFSSPTFEITHQLLSSRWGYKVTCCSIWRRKMSYSALWWHFMWNKLVDQLTLTTSRVIMRVRMKISTSRSYMSNKHFGSICNVYRWKN